MSSSTLETDQFNLKTEHVNPKEREDQSWQRASQPRNGASKIEIVGKQQVNPEIEQVKLEIHGKEQVIPEIEQVKLESKY